MRLKDLSIRGKVTAIAMQVACAALVLSSTGFLAYDLLRFRKELAQDLATQADIIGSNSTAALAFEDRAAAVEILSALRAKEEIITAALYDRRGELFATYLASGSPAWTPPAHPTMAPAGAANRSEVLYTVRLGGERIGTLYLCSDLRRWNARLVRYGSLLGLLMLGAAGAALFLASRLQAVISGPILGLKDTMLRVSAGRD